MQWDGNKHAHAEAELQGVRGILVIAAHQVEAVDERHTLGPLGAADVEVGVRVLALVVWLHLAADAEVSPASIAIMRLMCVSIGAQVGLLLRGKATVLHPMPPNHGYCHAETLLRGAAAPQGFLRAAEITGQRARASLNAHI